MKEAIESSTKEAIFALDRQTPLKLFDCLVPEIEAFRQLGQPITEQKFRANYEAKLQYAKVKLELHVSREPKLTKENIKMKKRLEKLEEEFQIVKWYIDVLEGGFDTKNLLKDFVQAQEDLKSLTERAAQERLNQRISSLKRQNNSKMRRDSLKGSRLT